MARLNEPVLSTDSLETLRRKMLRQNRDLAKSNNIRALRIRELESDCACMLSENLRLRSRILELEKEAEDNEARRIADHALTIKAQLESQLTEWGTVLAGLGLEPPPKRHSPRIRKSMKPRPSFSSMRPSPSQRRLRDVARDIEELGHISETKRMSMNPDQILALRSEADSSDTAESPDLGPPPTSNYIDEEPVKIDSPSRLPPSRTDQTSPKTSLKPPEALESPKAKKTQELDKPAEKPKEQPPAPRADPPLPKGITIHETTPAQPSKTGTKRKFAGREDISGVLPHRQTNENQLARTFAEKASIRERAGGKTLKEMANIRKEKESKENPENAPKPRKPLAAKSTNDDVASPKKRSSKPPSNGDALAGKPPMKPLKGDLDRPKPKAKTIPPIKIQAIHPPPEPTAPSTASVIASELDTPLNEPGLLSPNSPEPVSAEDGPRGDTPPPADITSSGETSRPSRRNRTAVSYAEPNLRDKMRRPSKALFDAVTGEGKYARRMSQCEPVTAEKTNVKRESGAGDAWKQLPTAQPSAGNETDSMPASPLASKSAETQELPSSVVTDRRRRRSSIVPKTTDSRIHELKQSIEKARNDSITDDTGDTDDVDVYEFNDSSPQLDKSEAHDGRRRSTNRPHKPSRKSSAAIESDQSQTSKERGASRRRSMMV